ncbi:major capsid protein [Wolbachia endosymbiont of Phyllotreta cruciferae]
MRNKHAITLEHLRMGALKGIILDADGSELLNLYKRI